MVFHSPFVFKPSLVRNANTDLRPTSLQRIRRNFLTLGTFFTSLNGGIIKNRACSNGRQRFTLNVFMISWFSITTAGSFTVMAPAAIAITVWLALNRAWRLVALWCALFIGGMGLVVATKIAFIGWGIGIRSLDFTGISGHAMRATAVAPVLLYLLLQTTTRMGRQAGIVLGLSFGVLIAYSRLVVHAHSPSEAISGWLLGATVALSFIRILSQSAKIQLSSWVIAVSLLGLLSSPGITPVPTQRLIIDTSLYLSGHELPYIRATWKMAKKKYRPAISD